MAFEVLPTGFNVSNFSATVHEHTKVHAPATIIRTDQVWAVRVRFETSGALSEVLPGTWHVGVYIESIGPGLEIQAGFVHVPLTPATGTVAYNVDVVIPAGTVTVPDHQARPFKLVTTVSYMWPGGTPGPMAGYLEGPIVQFYNPK
jgi:hypothetical protein